MKLKFAIASLLLVVGSAQAAGGLSFSNTGTTFSVTQGGNTNSVSLGSTTVTNPAVTASFTNVSFDATTFNVTGGTFTAGSPASNLGSYVSATHVNDYVTGAKGLISSGISAEVSYIGTLVTNVGNEVITYNNKNLSETDQLSADAQLVVTAYNTLTNEVNNTKSVINSIKLLKFNSAVDLVSNTVVINGNDYDDYTGSNIIQSTGGTSTIDSSGVISFQ